MNYPVICLFEEKTNYKIFIFPQINSLMDYARNQKVSDEEKLDLGMQIFTSTMPKNIKKEALTNDLTFNNIDVLTLTVPTLEKGLEKFECFTLMSPNDYDCYYVMNEKSLPNMEKRDWDAVNEFVTISRDETPVVKKSLKLH